MQRPWYSFQQLGAVNAFQDACILANGFYDLKDTTPESITAMFKDYVDQRFERAKTSVEQSHHATRILGGQVNNLFLATYVQVTLRASKKSTQLTPSPTFLFQFSLYM